MVPSIISTYVCHIILSSIRLFMYPSTYLFHDIFYGCFKSFTKILSRSYCCFCCFFFSFYCLPFKIIVYCAFHILLIVILRRPISAWYYPSSCYLYYLRIMIFPLLVNLLPHYKLHPYSLQDNFYIMHTVPVKKGCHYKNSLEHWCQPIVVYLHEQIKGASLTYYSIEIYDAWSGMHSVSFRSTLFTYMSNLS